MRELPVLSGSSRARSRRRFPPRPRAAEPFAAVLRDLDEILVPGITHWNHPRFFAYFAISGSEPGILAELLTAALNVNAMLWRTSPAATELEEVAVDWLRQLVGLPEGLHGHIEDTASTSTLAALGGGRQPAARRRGALLGARPFLRRQGGDGSLELPLEKIPPTPSSGCVAAARARRGPRGAGSRGRRRDGRDDLQHVGRPGRRDRSALRRAGAWLHVDAAYAGPAMVCEENRWAFAGVERADSIVVNPHKWLFTPIDCSVLYTRRPDVLRDAFSILPEYLRTSDEDVTN